MKRSDATTLSLALGGLRQTIFTLLAVLAIVPCANADSFQQFTTTGSFGPGFTLTGGFTIDETTAQVAAVDMFVTLEDPNETLNVDLFGSIGTVQPFPEILEFNTFDAQGDLLNLALVFPGNTGSFQGYTGGLICGEDYIPACFLGPGGGSVASAFIIAMDGPIIDLDTGSVSVATPEPGVLLLLGPAIAGLFMRRRTA